MMTTMTSTVLFFKKLLLLYIELDVGEWNNMSKNQVRYIHNYA